MSEKTAVIDRIEEGFATIVPDDGSPVFELYLPDGFFEGQAVVYTEDSIRPAAENEAPKKNNRERLNNLFNKNK